MARIGAYTEWVARHEDTQQLEQTSDGSILSVVEVYGVLLPKSVEYIDPTRIRDLPEKDSQHSKYETLFVAGYSWSRIDTGSRIWSIRVRYERRERVTSQAADAERIVSLDWGTESGQADLVSDQRLGLPVVNSAGDLFDTVPTFEERYPSVRLVQRERWHKPSTLGLNGCINLLPFTVAGTTFAPHTCRLRVNCRKIIGEEDLPFEYTYVFAGRRRLVDPTNAYWLDGNQIFGYESVGDLVNIGWDEDLVQAGFQYLSNGRKVKFTVANGDGGISEPSLPQKLDKDGAPSSTAATLVIFVYPDADFSKLRIPTTA